jgi:hypothetical protein
MMIAAKPSLRLTAAPRGARRCVVARVTKPEMGDKVSCRRGRGRGCRA